MNKRSCVGNLRFFYFDDDGNLELFHIQRKIVIHKKELLFSLNALK